MAADHTNPTVVSLPYTFATAADFPTEVMADRFLAWRVVIKDLVSYLKEYALVQEEIVRQQMRLQHAIGATSVTLPKSSQAHHSHKEDINLDRFFLPPGNGSVQDILGVLNKYHLQNVANASRTLKEINNVIIPKLEELRKDLLVKIKEIKNLHNDFKTNLGKELAETKLLLAQYHQAIENSTKLDGKTHHNHHHGDTQADHSKFDPYLVKIKLERQLRRQLSEETYLYDAYANLQNAGGKLESIIVMEIQSYISQFLGLLDVENQAFGTVLLASLNEGFLLKEPSFEWDSFISRNLPHALVLAVSQNGLLVRSGCFIDLLFPARKASDLVIPDYGSTLNIAVREGFMERRSKYLKSYSSGWYVLTCNYLHEFKSADRKRDQTPAMSLSLDSCTVTEHSKDDGKAGGVYKFILSSKLSSGLMNRTHNWVFRTDTYKSMIDWYTDIKSLTSLSTPTARARYLNKTRPETITTGDVLSGNSLHFSRRSSTMTREIRSPQRMASPVHRTASQTSKQHSVTTNNRLSLTFSQKNNQSPRLANMINSDGTIITPVATREDTQVNDEQHSHMASRLHDSNNGTAAAGTSTPVALSNASAPQVTAPLPMPGQYVATPQNFQYYIPPQAGQQPQFYDPVQQQYFTLTPSMPPHAQSVQGFQPQQQQMPQQMQHPQPQYFPTLPQALSGPQAASVPSDRIHAAAEQLQQSTSTNTGRYINSGSPLLYTINTASYFPLYPVQSEHLPYPTGFPDIASTVSAKDDKKDEIKEEKTGEEEANGEHVKEGDNVSVEGDGDGEDGEVLTLESGPQ